ncbi:nuclear RNA export factor 1-like isoform X2 [Zootermopsis nevadensis]|uniref:Nuclear RNA export factor 1 n=2 Tax=Zootermopsis nevadensis TaxID=136037 RepID=A0A067R9M2_ZOONE|nr:nuclear RNA export factor 1-like isoform X2 [Zootermopsis nevadensis]XP_021920092.1 nuclear RNA export factor 1-like isoform X2 [Zootermopsis nevadensis]XP_021920093.1 nuclear RNA export factor 1-like isoform X2 [Zootermopsis nevadensis]KDR19314.1 Nuclear RNA export factor 1 [Zootermopsis nevadensis]
MIHVNLTSTALSEEKKPDYIVLDSSNALSVILGSSYCMERCFINRKDCWHKFMILNGSIHDKEFILKVIMDAVYPIDLIPVMYKEEGEDTCFLARNCGTAIERLCRSSLVIDIPNGPSLTLRIVLGFAHINDIHLNMQWNLIKVIGKRFNKDTKYLDLSNYHRDPDLCDLIFCPLSQPKILQYVLNAVKSALPLVTSLNLSHNDIHSVKSLEALWQFKLLAKLDLRHNMVKYVKDLAVLQPIKLCELLLDQNPLCQYFDSEYPYISAVRRLLPSLLKLDGVVLGPPGFHRPRRNFLLPPEDSSLADQFIRHYFTLYDCSNRKKLEGLYHSDALFSLTATYLPAQSTSNTARLTEYTIESRNLLKLCDYTKSLKLLYHGSEAILATLCKLPRSEHDPYSFRVDLVHSAFGILISVTGVFREPATIKTPLIRSFCRVFVLVQIGPREFQIANETLHVKNATTKEAEEAFKIPKPPIRQKLTPGNPVNMNESDKEHLTKILSQLTEMNVKWSRKCLEESKWDIKKATTVFTELYKMSKIPPEAFSNL